MLLSIYRENLPCSPASKGPKELNVTQTSPLGVLHFLQGLGIYYMFSTLPWHSCTPSTLCVHGFHFAVIAKELVFGAVLLLLQMFYCAGWRRLCCEYGTAPWPLGQPTVPGAGMAQRAEFRAQTNCSSPVPGLQHSKQLHMCMNCSVCGQADS